MTGWLVAYATVGAAIAVVVVHAYLNDTAPTRARWPIAALLAAVTVVYWLPVTAAALIRRLATRQ